MSDLLLDTCAVIWLSQGGGKLSSKTLDAINQAKFVYVSAISAWELSLLTKRKQLELPMETEQWFSQFLLEQQINLININSEIAFLSNKLPWHHRDPADRFILATAINQNLKIVTGDKQFLKYETEILS